MTDETKIAKVYKNKEDATAEHMWIFHSQTGYGFSAWNNFKSKCGLQKSIPFSEIHADSGKMPTPDEVNCVECLEGGFEKKETSSNYITVKEMSKVPPVEMPLAGNYHTLLSKSPLLPIYELEVAPSECNPYCLAVPTQEQLNPPAASGLIRAMSNSTLIELEVIISNNITRPGDIACVLSSVSGLTPFTLGDKTFILVPHNFVQLVKYKSRKE